jgi:hypothetical protein
VYVVVTDGFRVVMIGSATVRGEKRSRATNRLVR